jgi:hypothetical protein
MTSTLPSPSIESGGEKIKDTGMGDGSTNQGAEDGEWAQRLPERERNALQAGRRERFTPHFESEVSQYFLELAK